MPILFVILLLTTVEQFAIDIYLPSLPAMGEFFGASDAQVQASLSLYMIGFALSPLFLGPVTDRFGRRPIILLGLAALLVSSLACALAATIHVMLIGRFLMGLAGGMIVVANQAMVRDSFSGPVLVRVASYMSMAWSLVPIIAPAIGGYMQHLVGWQGNFYLMSGYVLLALLLVFWQVPETKQTPPKSLRLNLIVRKYLKLMSNKLFIGYLACTAITFAVTTVFITGAPFLFQDVLGLDPVQFGWLLLVVAVSYLGGTYANTRLLNHYSPHRLLAIGTGLLCLFGMVGLLVGLLGYVSVLAIAFPAAAMIFAEGLVYPNAAALAFEPIVKNVGAASAVYICVQLLTCGVASAFMAYLPETTQVPMMAVLFGLSLLLGAIYLFGIRRTPTRAYISA